MRVAALILTVSMLLSSATAQEKQDKQTQKEAKPEKPAPQIDPFADPHEELAVRAEKARQQQRFDELKAAAEELAQLSRKMSDEIAAGGKDVVSVKIFQNLDRAEKLVKTMRSKVK